MKKVLVLDTSILCVWLRVPGKESCGHESDKWDKQRVDERIESAIKEKVTFVLPLATIIETGNHISQAAYSRKERAEALADLMNKSADQTSPWAAFSEQSILWTPDKLKKLAEDWPNLAVQKLSLGDATIKDVAEYYAQAGYTVEIFTGDRGLKAYEPAVMVETPRRRQR
ncbi:MAG: hypothetical protein KDJ54_15170 [Candidatus Competibacteraceae bacterium]|nr:hypothetical protein [Candidatus Competibacteraceae bacterium]